MRSSLSANADRLAFAAAILCLLIMAVIIATSPAERVTDERWHLRYTEQLRDTGWLKTMTAATSDHSSSVGPIYPGIHLAISPLTKLQPPGVRWVNYVCLLLSIVVIARSLVGDWDRRRALVVAASIISVPYLWPSVGVAFTEMPAFLPFSLFVLAMIRALALPDTDPPARAYKWAALAGLALGVAILARQTYLASLPPLFAMLVFAPRKWKLALICAVVTGLVCGWLFVLWRGLLPPYLHFRDTQMHPSRVVLALSYIAAATLFLRPEWFRFGSWKAQLVMLAGATAIAIFLFDYTQLPAQGVFRRFGELGLPMSIATRIAMMVFGFLWAVVAARRAWAERHDPVRVFLYISLFALVAAPAKGFDFASRYVVGALGVLLLVVVPSSIDRWLSLRILAGSALGALSLLRYYRPS